MAGSEEEELMLKMVEVIDDIKHGLDPDVLAHWYHAIESEAKSLCPGDLKETIAVIRDPILPLKFEFKASRRVLPWVLEAIENKLNLMPFATRLYFQKLEEMLEIRTLRKDSFER